MINGGWGIDALVGDITRDHKDLDLFVESEGIDNLRILVSAEGFFETDGGRPENFVVRDAKGRTLDIHVFDVSAEGQGYYRMADGRTWVVPPEGLAGMGTILGIAVRCFSAALQLQCYSGYELDESDLHDIAVLKDKFPDAILLPEIVRPW